MRQFTDPLQVLFIKGCQLTENDDIYVSYSDKRRKVLVTVSSGITITPDEDGTILSVPLTQEQTGMFDYREPISVQVNWITAEGKRMATCVTNVICEENLIKEVLL